MLETQLEKGNPDVSTPSSSSNAETTAPYLRGFHDAERRREIVNTVDELPFFKVVLRHTAAVAPLAILWVGALWLISRGKRGPKIGSSGIHSHNNGNRIGSYTSTMGGGSKWNENFTDQGQEKGNFRDDLKKVFQNAMTPLSPRNFLVNVKGTKFQDVIGMPEAVGQVQQYVDFLKHPEKFTRLGARLPKGCLLSGPPGTGKTLLAKAVAGEADVPFFTCNGADFVELYAGSGPKRVRELFEAAKSKSPSVIFIDELDAVGSRSGQAVGSSISAEENRTINQLLAELDGLSSSESVVVFAATNFRDNIDKALLREGRFDRKVELSLPDQTGRRDLFLHYLKKIKLKEEDVSADTSSSFLGSLFSSISSDKDKPMRYDLAIAAQLASLTPGASPATIATVVNEAAINAAVEGHSAVPASCLFPSVDDVLWGKKQFSRSSRIPKSALLRTAWHESGHALVAWLLAPLQSDVLKISIIPRHLHASPAGNGGTGGILTGFTQQVGKEVLDMKTELSLFTDICVMLGGQHGELMLMRQKQEENQCVSKETKIHQEDLHCPPHLGLRGVSTGAQDDVQRATQVALESLLSFGMAPPVPFVADVGMPSEGQECEKTFPTHLGLLSYEPERLREGRIYQKHSSAAQALAEEEAGRLISAASQFVEALLLQHADALGNLAAALVEKKELHRGDLERLLGHLKVGSPFSLRNETIVSQDGNSSRWNESKKEDRDTTLLAKESLSYNELQGVNVKKQARMALTMFVQASEEASLKRTLGRSTLLSSSK